jgi:hypothetical protein
MTDLDELKDALHSTPDFEPAPLDLGPVMASGGRLRRRRRFAVGGASALAVAAVLVGGNQLIDPAAGPMPAGVLPSSVVRVDPPPSGVPSAINSSAPGILGKVVETGRWVGGRQWILYVETVNPDRLNVNLTLVLGRTKTGYIDDFTAEITAHDDAAEGRMSKGFHAVTASTVRDGRTTPTFGYYAGDATRITARDTATGRTVQAHLTAWSGFGRGEKAQIFWFDFTQGRPAAPLTALTAYDRNGTRLG